MTSEALRKILVAGAVVGALSAAACATNPIVPAAASVAVAQGDTALDAAYNVAAQAYLAQVATMPASLKATVRPLLVKAYPYVAAADKAETLGDATTVTAQAGAAMALIAQAKTALGVAQ